MENSRVQVPPTGARTRRGVAAPFMLAAIAVMAVACSSTATSGVPLAAGSSSAGTTAAAPTTAVVGGSPGNGTRGATGGFARPAATGTIATATPGLIEVQSTSSQTTVTYTSSTAITSTVAGNLSDVTVGACVVAISAGNRNPAAPSTAAPLTAAPSTGSATNPGSPGFTTPSTLSATQVQVTVATNGSCTAPGNGRIGQGSAGFAPRTRGTSGSSSAGSAGSGSGPGTRPNGPGAAGFSVVAGTVTAVKGSTLTVSVPARPVRTGVDSTGSSAPGTAPSPTKPDEGAATSTVTVTGSTTFTKSGPAGASALIVGQCAAAYGTANGAGAVAATRITVAPPTSAGCSTGFAGFGGRTGFGGRGGNGSGQAPAATTGA